MIKTEWKVYIGSSLELENLLNSGWCLEKFQAVLTLGPIQIVAILSKAIEN